MRVSKRGAKLIANFEGFSGKPYRDAVGVWTIGFGHTHGVSAHSARISRRQALELLRRDLTHEYAPQVARLLRVPLTQNQADALVSFAYNVGTGALANSTLLKLLNQGKRRAAADEFLKWDKAGGRRLLGLTRRRRAERALFLRHPIRAKLHQLHYRIGGSK